MAAEAEETSASILQEIASLIDELRSDDTQVQLRATKNLHRIAKVLGPERTRKELIPYIGDSFCDDDDVSLALAKQLGNFIDVIGGGKYADALLAPLEQLCAAEEVAVRDEAVKSVKTAVSEMPQAKVEKVFPRFLNRLATKDWFTCRISACGLVPFAYAQESKAEQKQELRKIFGNLCEDEVPMVRRAAASVFSEFCKHLEPGPATQNAVSWFKKLIEDDQDSVRVFVVDHIIALARDNNLKKDGIYKAAIKIISDPSWRVRWAVASKFVALNQALSPTNRERELVDKYVKLLKDQEAEVRVASTYNVGKMFAALKDEFSKSQILLALDALVGDDSEHVRVALASVITEVLSSTLTDKASDRNDATAFPVSKDQTTKKLLALVKRLLKDVNADVRLEIIQHLSEVKRAIDLHSVDPIDAIIKLAEDKKWRVRHSIIKRVPVLAKQLGIQYYDKHLKSICLEVLSDCVYAVRVAAAENLKELAEIFGAEWCDSSVIPKVLELKDHTSYLKRLTMIRTLQILSDSVTRKTLETLVLSQLLKMAADKVPNVRFYVARALVVIIPKLSVASIKRTVLPVLQTLSADVDKDVVFYTKQASATAEAIIGKGSGFDTATAVDSKGLDNPALEFAENSPAETVGSMTIIDADHSANEMEIEDSRE